MPQSPTENNNDNSDVKTPTFEPVISLMDLPVVDEQPNVLVVETSSLSDGISDVNDNETFNAETGPVNERKSKIYVTIEGNIGSGKSTLLRILEEEFGEDEIELLKEPVADWQDCDGENILGAFYSDGKRYAYLMQTVALVTRDTIQSTHQSKKIRFSERSTISDECFAKVCEAGGFLNKIEVAARNMWYRKLVIDNKHATNPSVIFYLKTEPEVCHERVVKRARKEEDTLGIDYLRALHNEHEKWLSGSNQTSGLFQDSMMKIPVIVLDGNSAFQDCKEARSKLVEIVKREISQRLL